MKEIIEQIQVLGNVAKHIYWRLLVRGRTSGPFVGSAKYWEQRYLDGGNSGAGSYALFAEFKAEVLNAFVAAHHVQTVIEFGCGDGHQLSLLEYPEYLGFDVSDTAVALCRERFKPDRRKSFLSTSEYNGQTADLALSLDVIYHVVEDEVFERYMSTLFNASNRYVIVYSSDYDSLMYDGTYIRHRKFTRWIKRNLANWSLVEHVANRYPYHGDYLTGSFADFFIFEKT